MSVKVTIELPEDAVLIRDLQLGDARFLNRRRELESR